MGAKLKIREKEPESQAAKCSRGEHEAGGELASPAYMLFGFSEPMMKFTRMVFCKHCRVFYAA